MRQASRGAAEAAWATEYPRQYERIVKIAGTVPVSKKEVLSSHGTDLRPASMTSGRFGSLGSYQSTTRLLFQTFFGTDDEVGIGRLRVLCDCGLSPEVQTFDVSTACL